MQHSSCFCFNYFNINNNLCDVFLLQVWTQTSNSNSNSYSFYIYCHTSAMQQSVCIYSFSVLSGTWSWRISSQLCYTGYVNWCMFRLGVKVITFILLLNFSIDCLSPFINSVKSELSTILPSSSVFISLYCSHNYLIHKCKVKMSLTSP